MLERPQKDRAERVRADHVGGGHADDQRERSGPAGDPEANQDATVEFWIRSFVNARGLRSYEVNDVRHELEDGRQYNDGDNQYNDGDK